MSLSFGPLDTVLEGAKRPGHFAGVGFVVVRLLNTVAPDTLYLGAKDLQQIAVIKTLVRDLALDVQVHAMPTQREASGLAMSSRNARLSPAGRQMAAVIYQSLQAGRKSLSAQNPASAARQVEDQLSLCPQITIEYIEVVHPETFEVLTKEEQTSQARLAICIACWLDGVRLIDNLVIG